LECCDFKNLFFFFFFSQERKNGLAHGQLRATVAYCDSQQLRFILTPVPQYAMVCPVINGYWTVQQMAQSKVSADAYTDVLPIWQAADAHGYARVEMGTPGRAIKLLQRLNSCRASLRRLNYENHKRAIPDRHHAPTKYMLWQTEVDTMAANRHRYDRFIIRRPDKGSVVEIQERPKKPYIAVYDKDGDEIPLPVYELPPFLASECLNDADQTFQDVWGKPAGIGLGYAPQHAGDIGLDADRPLGLDTAPDGE
jgi:hypothetical protein